MSREIDGDHDRDPWAGEQLGTVSFTVLDQTFRFFNKDLFSMTPLDTGVVLAFIGVVG